jgi:hypothetical protein
MRSTPRLEVVEAAVAVLPVSTELCEFEGSVGELCSSSAVSAVYDQSLTRSIEWKWRSEGVACAFPTSAYLLGFTSSLSDVQICLLILIC